MEAGKAAKATVAVAKRAESAIKPAAPKPASRAAAPSAPAKSASRPAAAAQPLPKAAKPDAQPARPSAKAATVPRPAPQPAETPLPPSVRPEAASAGATAKGSAPPAAAKPPTRPEPKAKTAAASTAAVVTEPTPPRLNPAPVAMAQPPRPPAGLSEVQAPAPVPPPGLSSIRPAMPGVMMKRDGTPPPRMPSKPMEFKAGDHVVYPTHGVGTVQGIETMTAAGMALQMIVVTFDENRMTLKVPVNKAASSGLRKLTSSDAMQEALDVLKGKARVKRTMWSRRAQEYEQKINSGDPVQIAEVVRDLHRNAGQPDQSFSERQIYEQAMERLASELAAIDSTDKGTATEKLLTHLKVG
ncbi:MAG: CarD family transcriptional regulator [Acetobacteraceae bacterium]|nr:CarD family transcriptional regulator [Acetobacteraceae bacterium]